MIAREEYERVRGALPGRREERDAAFARFETLGLPTRRDEAWRHTDFSVKATFTHRLERPDIDAGLVDSAMLGRLAGCRLVFVNGQLVHKLSRSSCGGSLAESLSEATALATVAEQNAFAALNTALFNDGAFVRVDEPREDPVHLVFVTTEGSISHPRVLIEVAAGASARIVEEYVGLGAAPSFSNAVTEIVLGAGARLDHTKLQREPVSADHVATIAVRQGRDSRFNSHSISLGGARARHDIHVTLDGEGAECSLDGLYRVRGEQLVDHHTTIDHVRPHTTSRQLYKGILAGRSRGVFNGRVIVRPDAQKTDAEQSNKNLLLSDEALVNSNPQLEIFANDVRCRHGSSIGQLSTDEMFYLRARGIGGAEARRMLVTAFGEEMIDRLTIDPIRAALSCLMAVHA